MAGVQGSRSGDRMRQIGLRSGRGGCEIKGWRGRRSGRGGEVMILQEWRREMDRDARSSSKTASWRAKRWYLIIIIAAAAAVVEAVPAA